MFELRNIKFILIFYFFLSCDNKETYIFENEIGTIEFINFTTTENLKFQTLGTSAIGRIETMEVFDSLLFLGDLRSKQNLQIFDIKNNKHLVSIIKRGKNLGEGLNISSIVKNVKKRQMYVYDVTLRKIFKLNMPLDSNQFVSNEYLLGNNGLGIYSLSGISDEMFYGLSYSDEESRFLEFDYKGSINKRIGKLPEGSKNWPKKSVASKFGIKASIFEGILNKHPKKNRFVISYKLFDRLDIYSSDSLEKVIIGPDILNPEIKFLREFDDVFSPMPSKGEKYAHMECHVTENYIFTLYSGLDSNQTCGNTILVFDWDGNPIKKLLSEKLICSITVDEVEDGILIFSIDNDNNEIITSKIII